ncbi:hypothetical protein JZ751_024567 [Albula glossodonta]|uniref:Myeloid-derived growth factor n=1 Tax=Albula glossodonta TaxID=121402 RepID=A0A8T2PLP9_9TELE|nr:hypothetical protein JZ751_024567 [Albula glossodonta]
MSVGLSDDESHFSCSVWRPQGKSYLFFTQFKAEVKGAKWVSQRADVVFCVAPEDVQELAKPLPSPTDPLNSQAGVGGQNDVALKEEEYTVGDHTVTQTDGKFRAQLSKLTVIGRTRHDEL